MDPLSIGPGYAFCGRCGGHGREVITGPVPSDRIEVCRHPVRRNAWVVECPCAKEVRIALHKLRPPDPECPRCWGEGWAARVGSPSGDPLEVPGRGGALRIPCPCRTKGHQGAQTGELFPASGS